ncbi:hypothetical protein ACXYTJ_16585 [Gilvimarinus sp. F26214L]|uniref:hypothetical protein n=1 Tax=Gilvimarinus sp. DZF01 TaxID=3461371 RepID=UPI0040458889
MLTLVPRDRLIGVVVGPVLWSLQFVISYLVTGVACTLNLGRASVGGLSIAQWLLVLLGILFGGAIVAAAFQAQSGRRDARSRTATDAAVREEFLYSAALGLCGLSLVGSAWLVVAAVITPLC